MTPSTQKRRYAHRVALALLAFGACALLLGAARAEDGTEANTFGADGTAAHSLGTSFVGTAFENVLARPDGGLLARQGSRVVALLANGAPDPAFASIPAGTDGSGVFPAAGGKVFVVDDEKVSRLNADGTPDASFGKDGTVEASVRAVGELGSGQIVLAGISYFNAKNPGIYVGAQLLHQDGSPVGRVARFNHSSETTYDTGFEVVPAPDGGALIAGSAALLRLRADGSRDRSFGEDGQVSGIESFVGVRFLPDGSIEALVDDYFPAEKRTMPAVFRYTADGDPDKSFGKDGVEFIDLPDWREVGAVLWGADGSAIIGGSFETGGTSCGDEGCEAEPAVAALDPAGKLDPNFGEGGQIRISSLANLRPNGIGRAGHVTALARRPDGSIVAVGAASPDATVAFAAALSPQGALLPSFGEGGIVQVPEAVPARQAVTGLASLPGGQILAAGESDVGVGKHPVLVRYTPDGGLDPAFGGGTGYVSLGGNAKKANGFAVRGEQALVGVSGSDGGRLTLLSTADGSPVASFGQGGQVDLRDRYSARALTLTSDGDAVALDSTVPEGEIEEPVLIERFGQDGEPDRAFGRGGRVLLGLPEGGLRVNTLLAGPGGRVFVGGSAHHRFVIASLLPDGRLDPRFGSGGWSTTKVGRETGLVALARQGHRLYLAGVTRKSQSRVVLARFDLRGHLDRGFGRGGMLAAPVKYKAEPTAIVPTRTGAVVVVDRGRRPVSVFAGDRVEQQRPIGAERLVGDVRATVSLGRLIVGWTPRSLGLNFSTDYHLSAGPSDALTR